MFSLKSIYFFTTFSFFFRFIADKKIQNELLEDNTKLTEELEKLKKHQHALDDEIKSLTTKFNKVQNERNALDKLNKMKVENISRLVLLLSELLAYKINTGLVKKKNDMCLHTYSYSQKYFAYTFLRKILEFCPHKV